MSQIDILIYFPLLIWYIFCLFLFYFLIFWIIVPLSYFILRLRLKYYINTQIKPIDTNFTKLLYIFFLKK